MKIFSFDGRSWVGLLAVLAVAACGDSTPPPPPAKPPSPPPPVSPMTPPWPPMDKSSPLSAQPDAANYYVVFDASGSMGERNCADGNTKIAVAKSAVSGFAKSLPGHANFGLLAFDGAGVGERIPLSQNRIRDLDGVLARIHAGGNTPLKTSITAAYRAISEQGRRQLGYGEYHLIVVTDGEFTPGSEDPRPIVAEILDKSPVVVHTIGFCIDANHSLNQPGRVLYKSANNPQELKQGLEAVLAEAPAFAVSSFKP